VRPDVAALLPEYALGALPAAEMADLAARIEASPELQRELAAVTEVLVGATALPPVIPSIEARSRLLGALGGPDRFRPFFAELARRFDLGVEAIRALLVRVDDPAAWEPTPSRHIQLIHFAGGPALGAADAGFVRVAAGKMFPRHGHLGREMSFVLEGRMFKDGQVFGPGQIDGATSEHVHEYTAGPERDLVVMVWHDGIVLTG
jgi:putative transcriptional regulator